jgi:hypothetical protein
MTTDNADLRSKTRNEFLRLAERTHIRETSWIFTKMRALNVSYNDGLHHLSFITHDGSDRRQTVAHVHRITELTVNPDDDLSLVIEVRSEEGTPLTIHFHDVTLARLMEALDTALLAKASTPTETV